MKSTAGGRTVLPYPRTRLLMVDGGQMALRKHTIHGLVEFDITRAREAIRSHTSKPSPAPDETVKKMTERAGCTD